MDGVFARATKDGVFTKSGKPLDVPHIRRRMKLHFLLRPKSEVKGELYREGMGIEKIAGAAREGGKAAGKLRLHAFPDQGPVPLPIGATRRIKAVTARTPEEVEKAYRAALAKGHEGAMVRHPDGRIEKKKPRQDAEFTVESWGKGKRGVIHVSDPAGKRFRVQSRGTLKAAPGDRVTVSYSGTTRNGVPKAAVAERVRNQQDFASKEFQVSSVKFQEKMKTQANDGGRVKDDVSDQVRKDRRALIKGALIAAGGLAGLAVLARKSRGPAAGVAPWVPQAKPEKALKGAAAARANGVKKYGEGAVDDRALRVAALKRDRAWEALRPFGKRTAKQPLPVIAKAQKLAAAGKPGSAVALPGNLPKGQMAPLEAKKAVSRYGRLKRKQARQELLKLREARKFDTGGGGMREFEVSSFKVQGKKRDAWDKTRDAAVAAGALGSGGAAIYGAREWGKTNQALRGAAVQAAETVKDVGRTLNPKEVARAGVHEVKRGVKGKLRQYFPTFAKWAKQLKRPVRFCTPAGRLIEFAGQQQMKDPETRAYADPLRVAAGMQRGYWQTDKGGTPIVKDVPMLHGQVIRSAMNKGEKVHRAAKRGGSLAKDVADTVRGKERQRDASGRVKKKEWEKQWFRNKVGQIATAGALLGGAAYVRSSPRARGALRKVEEWGVEKMRKVRPDAFPSGKIMESGCVDAREFATPAGDLFAGVAKKARPVVAKWQGVTPGMKRRVAQREGLLGRLQARAGENPKAAAAARSVAANVKAGKQKMKLAKRRQQDALRGLKKGASLAGAGALAGGAAMKLHADQPEDRKVQIGARVRNALVGAAAGSFLGAGLHTGKSGFRGARIGAALGGLMGAVSDPKRKKVIEELPTASFEAEFQGSSLKFQERGFETPASRVIDFDWVAEDAGWDVRDPRGRSARVFAPGSRGRVRREKKWHEKADNERKLWKAAVVAAGVAGLAGGTVIGRKLVKKAGGGAVAPKVAAAPVVTPAAATGIRFDGRARPPRPVRR